MPSEDTTPDVTGSKADSKDPEANSAIASATTPLLHATADAMTPKEAYFELLRVWVTQANFAHNAQACFPYYLMTNYPQLMAPGPMTFPMMGATFGQAAAGGPPPPMAVAGPQAANMFGLNFGLQQQQPGGGLGQVPQPNQQALQRLAMNMFNRNRGRQEDMFDNQARNEEIINQNGGYEYVIAPLWKRFAAETIDVVLLFLLKLIVAFMIIDIFEIDIGFDFDSIRTSIEEDYTEFIAFSSEMIYIEIITKFFVCIYEALWTRDGFGHLGGATPGKFCMGLRVLYVEAVVPLPQQPAANVNHIHNMPLRALVFPAQNLGFRRAFTRALAKNLLMALMFPLCFIILFFRNNRTSYDIMTKTIVVEENATPVLRRL